VKIRVGFGLGTSGITGAAERFGPFVDDLERLGFDSLWFSERVVGPALDPLAAAAFAAGRTRKLKVGTSVLVLPGRNPVLLAKEMATIDRLSNGRFLPAVGLGAVEPIEQQAFGVAREERAAWFDEVLPLLRRLWTGEVVEHHGPRFQVDGLRIEPTPVQDPLEVWLGGRAPSELRRVGRMGDGWLPSFSTPDEVAAGRVVVEEAARGAGREIDPEHWGALVVYARGGVPDRLAELLRRRRPDLDVGSVIPGDLASLRRLLEQFCERGFSKFVVLPAAEPADWTAELEAVAEAVLPLQV
jgi:probable F420-dependent oxidoreductase